MSRVALVTGAAGGIGSAIVSELLLDNFVVVACDLERSLSGGRLPDLNKKYSERLVVCPLDVTSEAQFKEIVADVERRFERLDALVAAAGIVDPASLADLSLSTLNRHFEVNAGGVFLGMQACLKLLSANAPSAIVNIASLSGRLPSKILGAYGASKAAVISLTRTAASEFARFGVRVNAIAPGIVDTQMWQHLDSEISTLVDKPRGSIFAEQVRRIPLRRAATGDDVAPLARFLVSDGSRYITGQTINVDGGIAMN